MCSKNTSKIRGNEPVYHVVKLRLYPSPLQEQRLLSWLESLRWLYNYFLAWRKDSYQQDKISISLRQQRDALPSLKKQHPRLKYLPSSSAQDCLVRLQGAFNRFFERLAQKNQGSKLKAGYPRFKKYGAYRSLTYTQVWMTQTKNKQKTTKQIIKLEDCKEGLTAQQDKPFVVRSGELVLPKLGAVKVRIHRHLEWHRAKRVTIKQMPNGHWYACVCFQSEAPPPKSELCVGGVDLGLKYLVTTSEGEHFEHPRAFKKSEGKLKAEQKKLSRKKKGSANWEKQRQRVANVHHKIANQRRDFLHKLALWLVLSYDLIVFEDLNIKGMVKCQNFAKSIFDAGWGTLITLTTYKSIRLGGGVEKVDPRYTSQDCSRCGKRVPKTLADRMHKCPSCGLAMCRDQNAALNIKQRVGTGRSKPSGFS